MYPNRDSGGHVRHIVCGRQGGRDQTCHLVQLIALMQLTFAMAIIVTSLRACREILVTYYNNTNTVVENLKNTDFFVLLGHDFYLVQTLLNRYTEICHLNCQATYTPVAQLCMYLCIQ